MAIVHENDDFFTMNTIDLTPLSLMINGRENYFFHFTGKKVERRSRLVLSNASLLSLVLNLGSFKMNPGENLNLSSYF